MKQEEVVYEVFRKGTFKAVVKVGSRASRRLREEVGQPETEIKAEDVGDRWPYTRYGLVDKV